MLAFSRRVASEFCIVVPLSTRGRRESRALVAPAASREKGSTRELVTTGSTGIDRLSPRVASHRNVRDDRETPLRSGETEGR